jgi:hypothetical protein
MSKSLLNTQKGICFICGRYGQTDRHHLFFGTANRRLSEEDGLWVYLCPSCHNRPPNGAHFNPNTALFLHKVGQQAYEEKAAKNGADKAEARQKFMERYGKNYL